MNRKLAHWLSGSRKSASITLTSIVITGVGIIGTAIAVAPDWTNLLSKFQWTDVSNPSFIGKVGGVGILMIFAVRSAVNEGRDYFLYKTEEKRRKRYRLLEASTSIAYTEYDFPKFFDLDCSRIVVVAQNARSAMNTNPGFTLLDHLRRLLRENVSLVVEIILARPDAMQSISDQGVAGLKTTIQDLVQFNATLDAQEKSRVRIHFHTSPISLSMFMRVRHREGTIVITPKWALDRAPGGRVFIVIPEVEAPELYNHYAGHVMGKQ